MLSRFVSLVKSLICWAQRIADLSEGLILSIPRIIQYLPIAQFSGRMIFESFTKIQPVLSSSKRVEAAVLHCVTRPWIHILMTFIPWWK